MFDEKASGPVYTVENEDRARNCVLDMITIVTAPMLPGYLLIDVDMSRAEEFRRLAKRNSRYITTTAILLKAIGIAQKLHPYSRAVVLPFGKRAVMNKIVAGVTVERFINGRPTVFFGAIDEPNTKSLERISEELRDYSESAIENLEHLARQNMFNHKPWIFRRIFLALARTFPNIRAHFMGATFGITSVGKLGVDIGIAPCASTVTFGIGAVKDQAVVRDGEIVVRPILTIEMTFDMRVMSGTMAARFLRDVRAVLEDEMETESGVLYNRLECQSAESNSGRSLGRISV